MPLNGSGGATQPTGSIYPAVSGTLIESGKLNASIADIYAILSSAIYKDGQSTTTAAIPFAQGINTNTISERTSSSGVNIDGALVKDSTIEVTQIRDDNQNEAIIIATTASAVNEITVTNAATGGEPSIAATGGDTDIDLVLVSKGAGHVTAADDDFAIKGSADGTKRARFEVDGITTGTTRVITVPDADITLANWSTGDVKLTWKTTADSGWVMMNDGSIGSAASGATTRANADTEALFTLLWTNVADTYAPVSSGRGASAAADFAANKTLTLPASLGRALGLSGAGSGLTSRALGLGTGDETVQLTVAQLAAHTHSFSKNTSTGGTGEFGTGTTTATTASTDSTGGDEAHPNMQPTVFLNAMIKL